ncbi:hypothetical protein F511_41519 [Dorcoceras hygrometricum]|uniref:Uncharacterized protein n=1 Tax=Dorcoceras hygrometricum TaxID=472368 RepID=A0A2Z7CNJ8_9LAMI|nr:hypothetical protein F511_41519 [Dorcoceras hygrometricum]
MPMPCRAIDIEEGLLNMQAQVQPPIRQDFYLESSETPSSQPPQAPQSLNCQRFRTRGKQFKRTCSSSSRSECWRSGGSGSRFPGLSGSFKILHGNGLLRQPALEDLTNLPRTESPRRRDRNKSNHVSNGGGGRLVEERRPRGGSGEGGGGLVSREVALPKFLFLCSTHLAQFPCGNREASTCVTLNGSGIQLAVGSQPLRLRNHNFGLTHRIMVKRLATTPHDPLGITDSACKNHSVMVSVQYGPFNTYISIRSTTIGKSRVARDPITMHTSRRSNSDIACVTSIGYPRTKTSGESSTTKHRLLHASGPHPIPPPNDPN